MYKFTLHPIKANYVGIQNVKFPKAKETKAKNTYVYILRYRNITSHTYFTQYSSFGLKPSVKLIFIILQDHLFLLVTQCWDNILHFTTVIVNIALIVHKLDSLYKELCGHTYVLLFTRRAQKTRNKRIHNLIDVIFNYLSA